MYMIVTEQIIFLILGFSHSLTD